jgi:Peptidase family M48
MTLILLVSGFGLLVTPACARPLGRRLPPAEWAKACAYLLAVGAVIIEASLAIEAGPTLLRAVGLDGVAALCEHALGTVAPGGIAGAIAGGGIAILIALLASRSILGARQVQRTARAELASCRHGRLGGHDLVVLPSEKLIAFSTGGQPGQVVLSRGLITALSDDELAAVLRHEIAHVRHRHQRYLLIARAVERSLGLLPLVRRSVAALRCAVERWADEEAAGPGGTRRASVHAALLRVADHVAMPDIAAFTTPGTVVERLEALRSDPTGGQVVLRRTLVYLPVSLLLAATLVALGSILEHVSFLHMLAGLCPPH